jgi:hypothetical protein
VRELVVERLDSSSPRLFLGDAGAWPDRCDESCCRMSDMPGVRHIGNRK